MGRVGFGALKKAVPSATVVEVPVEVKAEPVAEVVQETYVAPVAQSAQPVVSDVKPKPKVIIAGAKTCPSDPALLAQCDSCQ
jgi:hypothetical protein